jgi:hypothetical protein
MKRVFFVLVICLFSFTLSAQMISEGWWHQTASTAGEGDNIAMEVTEMTPHIISLESNNGWVGYAWYVEEKNLYTGFFELLKEVNYSDKEDWSGEVFNFTLTYDGLTLTMKAKSKEHSFLATYWKK